MKKSPLYIQWHEYISEPLCWNSQSICMRIYPVIIYLYEVLKEAKWIYAIHPKKKRRKRRKIRTVIASLNETEVGINWEGAWREHPRVMEIISIRDGLHKTHQMVLLFMILYISPYVKFTFKKSKWIAKSN